MSLVIQVAALWLLPAMPGVADVDVHLLPWARVRDDSIRLADVADVGSRHGALAQLVLRPAPAWGGSCVVERDEIVGRLRALGADARVGGEARVRVTRPGVRFSQRSLLRLTSRFLRRELDLPPSARFEAQRTWSEGWTVPPTKGGGLRVRWAEKSSKQGPWDLRLELWAEGRKVTQRRFVVRSAGQKQISPRAEPIRHRPVHSKRKARMPKKPSGPALVRKGQRVVLVLVGGALTITSEGVALGSGALGAEVDVRVRKDRPTLRGRVAANGRVVVELGASK